MAIKICFYVSIKNENDEEIDLLDHYKTEEGGQCIYSIAAGEICSEFIARYFKKVECLPDKLLTNIIKESYEEKDYEKARHDMYNGMYRVSINKMLIDDEQDFKFKAYEESKLVREKLIKKHNEIEEEIKKQINNSKIETYALLEVA